MEAITLLSMYVRRGVLLGCFQAKAAAGRL